MICHLLSMGGEDDGTKEEILDEFSHFKEKRK